MFCFFGHLYAGVFLMKEYFFQLACAVCIGIILDCLLGDPRNFPHSVNLIGNSIRKAEKFIRRHMPVTPKAERLGGLILAAAICLISTVIPLTILAVCYLIDPLLYIVAPGAYDLADYSRQVSYEREQKSLRCLETGRFAGSEIRPFHDSGARYKGADGRGRYQGSRWRPWQKIRPTA